MKRILVIGCPGSGKSTFSKRLAEKMNYPILHLDRIFHIDNHSQISRVELKNKITDFIEENEVYIIDGNYSGTLEFRLSFSDTVFYFDIDPVVCLRNVIYRVEHKLVRDDIAPGFDNTIMDPEFLEYVKTFNKNVKPKIDEILSKSNAKLIKFFNYDEVEKFFINLNRNMSN
ncbi:MAG: AAA family ATPase [Tenericutes bacterium]|nr:AAA family ATPase [Mycoplasmatota bacterium]